MRRYRLGTDTRTDLKVHLVSRIPKYRKRELIGELAVQAIDVLRQMANKREIGGITGKVSVDHIHTFISYRVRRRMQGRSCNC